MSRALALALGVMAAVPLFGLTQAAGEYPEATEYSPQGADVSPEAVVFIEWSMAMNPSSVEIAFWFSDGSQSWDASDFTWTHRTTPPFISEADPKFPLASSTRYTALVAATATDVTGQYDLDQNGNGIGGEPTDYLLWSFTTADVEPPRVVQALPPDGTTNVSVATNVTIFFSEPMDVSTVEAAFGITPEVSGSFNWAGMTVLTFDPDLLLRFGTTYATTLDGALAKDANGNFLDGDLDGNAGGNFTSSFTTELDIAPPRVLAAMPQNGSANTSVSSTIRVVFSESMDRNSLASGLSFTDGSTTWTGANGTFIWTKSNYMMFEDDVVVFDPFPNFPFNATIAVTLNASEVRDPAGFGLDGDGDGNSEGSPTDDYSWTFSVEGADRTPPNIVAILPEDGARDVPETTSVSISFSEPMERVTVEGGFALRGGGRNWTKLDGTFAWTQGDQMVVYTPAGTIAQGVRYRLFLSREARDLNGNALDGDGDGAGGDDFESTFDTRSEPDITPPRVKSTIPAAGATGVPIDTEIVITFDDIMNTSATNAAVFLVHAFGDLVLVVPTGNFTWSTPAYTLRFQALEDLAWDAEHLIVVSQAAKDDAGNALESQVMVSFRTAKWTGRVVGRVFEGGAPVVGALVGLGNLTTRSEADGTFGFPSVIAGTYEITIEKPGFVGLRHTIEVDPRQAGPDGSVDLGTLSLSRIEAVSPFVVVGALGAAILALLAVGLLLRRRRDRFVDHFEDLEPEEAEGER